MSQPRASFLGLLGFLLSAIVCAQDPAILVGGVGLMEFPQRGEAPVTRMLSTGAEPKRELRYNFTAGETHRVAMVLRMSMRFEMNGRTAPAPQLPDVRFVFVVKVTEANDSHIRYEFSSDREPQLLNSEGTPPAVLEELRKANAVLSTMKGAGAMTNRGIPTAFGIDVGPGVDPGAARLLQSLRRSMEQMYAPLPAEAVGPGARWLLLQRTPSSVVASLGMDMYQAATYSLLGVEGSTVSMEVEVDQLAPRQEMTESDKPWGAKMELLGMRSQGRVRLKTDLRSTEVSIAGSVESRMTMRMQEQGKSFYMGSEVRTQVWIEPDKPR